MQKKENKIALYQDENGITSVSVRFSDEDLWLTQNQLAEIYDTTQQNIDQQGVQSFPNVQSPRFKSSDFSLRRVQKRGLF